MLIDTANSIQRKAFIALGYETGARPKELLNIRIKDILFDSKGAKVILRQDRRESNQSYSIC